MIIDNETLLSFPPNLRKLYRASKDSAQFSAVGALIAVGASFLAKDLAIAETLIIVGTLSGAIIGGLFGLARHKR